MTPPTYYVGRYYVGRPNKYV